MLKGRLNFEGGSYSVNAEYERGLLEQLAEAIDLLRRHGYVVAKKRRCCAPASSRHRPL